MQAAEKCVKYQRRRPELTPCYKIIQEHLNSFIADREAEGRTLPDYVLEEFDAYLKCGILGYGFLRLKCCDCKEEKIVAFSCKKRGFCPSCCAKRMAEAATHLVENVLPKIAYRQFVITFPIPLRYWLHSNKKLFSKVHGFVIKELHGYYQNKASAAGLLESTPGSISFLQRFGSALNLNPHLHILCPDGVYRKYNGKAEFHKLEAISDDEVAELLTRLCQRVLRYLKRKGYLDREGEIIVSPEQDSLFQGNEFLALASQGSIRGRIAFGPNASKGITKIGSGFGYLEEIPLAKGGRCFSVNGFSLHANTAIKAQDREGLRKLIEYIARGPLSNERLEISKDGKVKLELKTRFSDGTTHLLFTAQEFIEKLAAIIPLPKAHLVRWSGVFGPHSSFRREIILKPEVKKGFQFREATSDGFKNYSWSRMLAQVFKIDVTKCELCGGKLEKVCAITDQDSIKRYLEHLNIDHMPPARAPPRYRQPEFDFE